MTATKLSWKIAVKAGRSAQRLGDLRHATPRGTSRWASWWSSSPTASSRREGPVQVDHRLAREADPRPPPRERSPRRQAAAEPARRAHRRQRLLHGQRDDPELPLRRGRLQPARQAQPAPAGEGRPVDYVHEPGRDDRDLGTDSAYHTITACKAPCTGTTGIAYPLANAKVQFDSGELGFGPRHPAANRNTWSTPKRLKAGTYTYFCRIHPFMRGSFRVVGK